MTGCTLSCPSGQRCGGATAISLYEIPFQQSPWTTFLSKGAYGLVDLGATASNQLFASSSTKIIRRLCSECVASHRTVYYRRLTPLPGGFSIYDTLASNWFSTNNVLNVDFELYNTYDDALIGNNATRWQVRLTIPASAIGLA